jgi:hypothetical protein
MEPLDRFGWIRTCLTLPSMWWDRLQTLRARGRGSPHADRLVDSVNKIVRVSQRESRRDGAARLGAAYPVVAMSTALAAAAIAASRLGYRP